MLVAQGSFEMLAQKSPTAVAHILDGMARRLAAAATSRSAQQCGPAHILSSLLHVDAVASEAQESIFSCALQRDGARAITERCMLHFTWSRCGKACPNQMAECVHQTAGQAICQGQLICR